MYQESDCLCSQFVVAASINKKDPTDLRAVWTESKITFFSHRASNRRTMNEQKCEADRCDDTVGA